MLPPVERVSAPSTTPSLKTTALIVVPVFVTYRIKQHNENVVLRIRNSGSDAFLTPGSGIRMGKKSVSGSGMNNPDLIS
jgi:hypothetical protein